VKVLVVDPQPFFCESLGAALARSDGTELVGWTTDEVEAEQLAARHGPDVVLTEVQLGGGSGLSLARRLGVGTRTVILTRAHEGDVLLDAVASGAVGCLSHEVDVDHLPRHLAAAMEGTFVVDPARLHDVLRRASSSRAPRGTGSPKLVLLTAREREVLMLLARGMDNEEIGAALHLSAHTARTHVGNILRKLGVHSRADAARIALREAQAEADTQVLRIRGPDLGTG
jgi:DNA-binding NarL/FixJ family response regulator